MEPAKVADIEKTSGRKVLQILRTRDSIKIMLLSDLSPHPSNPRRITDKKLKMLEKSLKEFGDLSGIIFNKKTGHLVGGHQRLKVLPADVEIKFENDTDGYFVLNGDRFHVRVVEWDETKEKAANIAANQHGGDWHLGNLADWVNELDHLNIDMDLLGFDQEELAKLMAPTHYAGQCDEDEIPTPKETRCKRGDIWALGNHRVMCGDSTNIQDVERLMNGEKAELWLTDPPYGVDIKSVCTDRYEKTGRGNTQSSKPEIHNDIASKDGWKDVLRNVFINAFLVGSENCVHYVFTCQGSDKQMMMMMQEAGWNFRHELIWKKNRFILGRSDYHYQHEPILYGWKETGTHEFYGGRDKSSIIETPIFKNDLHPTMKPVELLEQLIMNSSMKDRIVLDTFLGSGSTLIACEKTNRRCFGMEIDPHYCDVILTRWEKFSGKTAHLITGEGQAH